MGSTDECHRLECTTHIFADELGALIVPSIDKDLIKIIEFIDRKGIQIVQNLLEYSHRWKQPINVSRTVVQFFHNQIVHSIVEIHMGNKLLENVGPFIYFGCCWTDKLSLASSALNLNGWRKRNTWQRKYWGNICSHTAFLFLRGYFPSCWCLEIVIKKQ